MSDGLTRAQDIFLDRINQICGRFGLNDIMAQLYAVLYLGNKPMSLDDMAQRLKISKGSASINIRALERYGAVRRVWVKGSRRDFYEAEHDIYKVIMDRARSMAHGRLTEIEEMLESSYKALDSVSPSGEEEKKAVKTFRQQLDKLRSLEYKAKTLFNLFNSGLLNKVLGPAPAKKGKKETLAV